MGKPSWAVVAGILLWASGAWAVDPAIRCQAEKLKAAAKYTACRLKAEGDAAKHFAAPDFSKCDTAFADAWNNAESRAVSHGTPCWTMGDAAGVQADIATHTDALAAELAGGGS